MAESSTLPASASYSSERRPTLAPLTKKPREAGSIPLRFYYGVKLFLPRRLRLAARRVHAARIRRRTLDTWPIYEPAGRAPAGWTGWPEGKQFAFVLTHDVETRQGLERVKPLAELEMEMGFRSAFYFIPEGPYEVPRQLRHWLMDRGFEVGVHDLHHDGKLFSSYDHFHAGAARINHYLEAWDAVGFRSGFMLRNLDWISELNIKYDASTFDTDPFEPQPDGIGTIFPSWIPKPAVGTNLQPASTAPSHLGYVELPYTLAQDSTLFLILREKGIGLWSNKLVWIAKCGGMALVNTHPDYIHLRGEDPEATFPAKFYMELLSGVQSSLRDTSWRVLPRELTSWLTDNQAPSQSSSQKLN